MSALTKVLLMLSFSSNGQLQSESRIFGENLAINSPNFSSPISVSPEMSRDCNMKRSEIRDLPPNLGDFLRPQINLFVSSECNCLCSGS